MEWAKAKKIPIPSQELTDIETRLRDLDAMKINKQVVYPTLFLTTTAEDVELEAALLRCYNDFMADACSKTEGRIRFAALVPIRDAAESIKELGRAQETGGGGGDDPRHGLGQESGTQGAVPVLRRGRQAGYPRCGALRLGLSPPCTMPSRILIREMLSGIFGPSTSTTLHFRCSWAFTTS